MAVLKKEQYRQQDGTDILKVYTKPTSKFPEGSNYFYVDVKDEDIVDSYTWGLWKNAKNIYVLATRLGKQRRFHDILCDKYLHYKPDYIDHIDGCALDNVDANLNIVTNAQNQYNSCSKGYYYSRLYGKEAIVTGRCTTLNVVSARSDITRFGLKVQDTITSVTRIPDCFACISLIRNYMTEKDARLAAYNQVFEKDFRKICERIRL